MSQPSTSTGSYQNYQEFLDENQYTKHGLEKYEWIFGETFLSTGGLETTKEILDKLELKSGMKVLDVGSGCGGSAFYMAEHFGCHVTGYDLSKNMLSVANGHLRNRPHLKELVNFVLGDVTTAEFPENSFDLVYSRDALLHIKDKDSLFAKFFKWLKPGGRVVFTDYGQSEKDQSLEFKRYVAKRGYFLLTVKAYEELLKKTGFTEVKVEDKQERFTEILNKELKKLRNRRKEFLQEFNQEDYDDLESGWEAKIKRSKNDDQTWTYGYGQKPVEV